MRKKDYEILAAAIKKHRESALGFGHNFDVDFEQGRAQGCEDVAHTFARFASVDKIEFLKACGIRP